MHSFGSGRSGGDVDVQALGRTDIAIASIIFVITIALRICTLGDSNYHADDTFYFLVGQRMHEGVLPYVDVWDRKPLGLFVIYYVIAAFSRAIWAYQLVAWVFLAATAWVVYRIVLTWTNRQGAFLAGLIYAVLTCVFRGVNGQAPVFYNLFVATAVLLIIRDFPSHFRGVCGWRSWLAMGLCGLGIAIKQTVVFESLFLGLYILWGLRQARVPTRRLIGVAIGFGAVGAAPTFTIAAYYALYGHWFEYWHAMVLANLAKREVGRLWRTYAFVLYIVQTLPMLAIVGWSLVRKLPSEPYVQRFLIGWLSAALVGFLSIPNFFDHYMLPLIVPLSVTAGLVFAESSAGRLAFTVAFAWSFVWYNPLDFRDTRKSIASMNRLATLVMAHDGGGGLLVYDGPPYLYALTGKPFISPLVFPSHLNHEIERDVSHLKTSTEMDRIIAKRPGVVVIALYPQDLPNNADSYRKIRNYANRNCRVVGIVQTYQLDYEIAIVVFGDCSRTPLYQGGARQQNGPN